MSKHFFKTVSRILSIILIIFVFGCGGDNKSSDKGATEKTTLKDVKKEIMDVIIKLKGFSFEQKEKAVAEAKGTVKTLDARIDSMQAKLNAITDEKVKGTKEQLQERIDDLKKQREQLNNKIDSLASSSADAWDDIKNGVSKSLQKLDSAIQEAENELKKDHKKK